MARKRAPHGVGEVLAGEEVESILREGFFCPTAPPRAVRPSQPPAAKETVRPAAREEAPPAQVEEPSLTRVVVPASRPSHTRLSNRARPEHYKVICISIYTEDLARLDAAVADLKRRGFTKANRSAVIRLALDQMDLSKVRRGL